MSSLIRQGASLTATLLETAAGLLRRVAEEGGEKPEPTPQSKPVAEQPAKPASETREPSRPAPATRSRISNPKAARKVRSRQG